MSRKINDNEIEIKSVLDKVQKGVLSPQDALTFLNDLSGLSESEKTLLRTVMAEILYISQQKQQVSGSEIFPRIAPYSRAGVGYSIQDELEIVANKAFSAKEELLKTLEKHIARGECKEIYVDDQGLAESSGVNINSKVISGKNYQDSLERLEKLASALRDMGLDVYHEQQNSDGKENAILAIRHNDDLELQDVFRMNEQDFYKVARRNQEVIESRQVKGLRGSEFHEAPRRDASTRDVSESFVDEDLQHSSKKTFADNVANVMRMQNAIKAFKGSANGPIQTITIGDALTVEHFHLNALKRAVASLSRNHAPSPSPAEKSTPLNLTAAFPPPMRQAHNPPSIASLRVTAANLGGGTSSDSVSDQDPRAPIINFEPPIGGIVSESSSDTPPIRDSGANIDFRSSANALDEESSSDDIREGGLNQNLVLQNPVVGEDVKEREQSPSSKEIKGTAVLRLSSNNLEGNESEI